MKSHLSIYKRLLGVFTIVFLLNSTIGTTQNSNKIDMKNQEIEAKITRYEVKKDYQEKFQKAVSDYVRLSLLNENNIMSEAYFEQENQAVIWVFERWINKNEFNKFLNNSQSVLPLELKERLVKPIETIEIKDLEPISKEQWRKTSKAGDKQLTIMLFVDAKTGTEENFIKIYHKAMPEFRSESGVVTYQLSQLKNDKSKFITFEKFRSKEAFHYHLEFPPIQPVIDYLNTSIKKKPFQDGIHTLIEFAPLTRE